MSDSEKVFHAEDASFRKEPPPPDTRVFFVPPHIEEKRLANGLRVLIAQRHDMPIVAMQIVVDRGLDLQNAPGVASMTATMMLTGTRARSALALSDDLEALGARYGAWANHDGMGVHGQVLRHRFSDLFAILADVARYPSFAEPELERERAKRLSILASQHDAPDILLENAVEERLYPEGHPFHAPMLGDKSAIQALCVSDLVALHRLAFRPAHATVTIAGDIDKDMAISLVEKSLGDWTGEAVPKKVFPEPRPLAIGEKRIVLLDRPGSSQSNVALAVVGIARKNPDYDTVMVLNTILGGQFSSRLNLNLREKHAYTYGAYSVVEARGLAGPITAGGAITTESTAPAIREMFAEINRLRSELVPDAELQNAKTNLIRKLPARFETAAGTAQALGSLAVLALPLDAFATRQTRAAQVTAEDVLRVALLYLRPEMMRIFVVGDASSIGTDLEKLNLGEIELLRAATEVGG
jgi:zinc protease